MTVDIELPAKPELTPEAAFVRLQAWYAMQQQLAEVKTGEIVERKALATYYFPAPVEGTNRLPLGGGFDLKLVQGVNRKVDDVALAAITAAQVKKHKLDLDELFPMKPTLSKTAYNKLSDEQRAFVDTLLDIDFGTPAMAIVAASDKEETAAARPKREPKAAKAAEPAYVVVENAEDAQPGNYYTDGDGGWWQLSDDMEWVDATDPADIPAPPTTRKRRGKQA